MRTLIILIAIFLTAGHGFANPDVVDIDELRWQKRVVLIGSTADAASKLATMDRRLAAAASGLRERDVVVIRTSTSGALARTWSLDADFELVLVGKDGTEKLRATEPIEVRSLFELIDAMPMRQQEMRATSKEE